MSGQVIRSRTELDRLMARLKLSPAVAIRVAQRVAPVLSQLEQQAFDAQQTPYGNAWTPNADGVTPDLVESGALREKALQYKAVGTKIRVSVAAVRYARYQLKKGILPKQGSLPPTWEAVIRRIADEEIAREMRGAA